MFAIIILFTCFASISSFTHTAHDGLPSLAQSLELLQLKEPETPQEFMQQLRRAENTLLQAPNKNDPFQLFGEQHTIAFNVFNETYQQESLLTVKAFMQHIGCAEFHDYFIALASSRLPNKTDDVFVKIPYFKKLAWQPQEEVDAAFNYYNELKNEPIYYPINRLFLAAFLGTPINLNKCYTYGYPSLPTLQADDIELLKKLLRHDLNIGADMGIGLLDCKSLQAAQLFLIHGADFDRQHKEYDLIDYQCCFRGSGNDSSLLALFLPHAPLDKTNQYGKKWFKSLITDYYWFPLDDFVERIAILLQYGCYYDKKTEKGVLQIIDTKSKPADKICYKAYASQLFKQEERSRKNVVIGLHQRGLTGRSFGYKRAPQT